ncbi:glycoside hydrolase family 3 protein [[Clostridium] fimetarium]|uniref:beta-N-acetylhexosaminidase n=1 Tax=[Clostridium] fimetarium TaxID=99656 RepID=A0A1I0NCM8_9FIRM|nr:glycoside hydrolase family 3 N-terminal domain-containing protein [[Clostridium] fimetarium]SEV99000.1 beta-N-acetylhexosaminidase [[Clostridium] fimetarium]
MLNLKTKPFFLSEEQIAWVEKTLGELTTDEKVEQLFCPLIYTNNPDVLKNIISKQKFGAVMFRSGNAIEIQTAINALQETSKIPLLISANLEDGGNGIADEGTYMGRQMLIAATDDTRKAYQLGKICGREGKAVGVNWAFSPVVDIDINFRSPITNVRTYGSNPDKVLSMGRSYIKGLTEEGLIPSIKHFPGDGVDERDQHLVTSVNSLTIEEWEENYGKVYRALIEDGAMTAMVGHIAMPAMEEYFDKKPCTKVIPASVSHNVITGYLRGVLGFNGLISTDASPMVGFTSVTQRRTAVPAAIENGCDVFLFTRDLEEDIQYMKKGVEDGLLSEKRLNEAVTRILATKAAMGLPTQQKEGRLYRTEEELKVFQSQEHLTWAKECADEAVTLVKDTQNLLPLIVNKHIKVLLEILGDFTSNDRVYEQFETLLKKEGFQVTKYIPETMQTIFQNTKVADFKAKYDLVVYIGNIENASNNTVARINWHTLFGAGNNLPWFADEVPTLFISVGNPYHLFDVPMIKTYINGYCNSPYVIDSVVDKIMGRSRFKGQSPVDPFCGVWDTRL